MFNAQHTSTIIALIDKNSRIASSVVCCRADLSWTVFVVGHIVGRWSRLVYDSDNYTQSLKTDLVGDSDSNNTNAETFDGLHFAW